MWALENLLGTEDGSNLFDVFNCVFEVICW